MAITAPQKTLSQIQEYCLNYLKQYNKNYIIVLDPVISWDNIPLKILENILPNKVKIVKPTDKNYLNNLLEEAKKNNSIIGSFLTKEKIFFGMYNKYGYQNVDIFPFGDLYWTELEDLAKYLKIEFTPTDFLFYNQSISKIEWAVREDERVNIIKSNEDPSKNYAWLGYVKEQKDIIAKLYITFHKNLHKNNNKLIIKLRNISGLVR